MWVQVNVLDKEALAAINGYNPGLSGAWMLQRAMSIQVGQQTDPTFINQLLSKNFAAMKRQGPSILRPFLQVNPLKDPTSALDPFSYQDSTVLCNAVWDALC